MCTQQQQQSPWHAYLERMMVPDQDGSVPVAECAIWSRKTGEECVWATTEGLSKITAEEVKKLNGPEDAMRMCGPKIAGLKYMLLRDCREDCSMYCLTLKSVKDEKDKTYCACVGVTNTALVIARGTESAQGGQLTKMVYPIVTYMRDCKY